MIFRKCKKGVLGPVISVFVMVLVISILAGLTFLFISQLKQNVLDTSDKSSATVSNEAGWINASGYQLMGNGTYLAGSFVIVNVWNATTSIAPGNFTLSSDGRVTNASSVSINPATFNYTHNFVSDRSAYAAVNDTEAAGATVVNYLSLIFLAVIFGAILTLVLRIILPYIDLGKQTGGF